MSIPDQTAVVSYSCSARDVDIQDHSLIVNDLLDPAFTTVAINLVPGVAIAIEWRCLPPVVFLLGSPTSAYYLCDQRLTFPT